MTTELFLGALVGHIVGDYLLQPKDMAIMKSRKDWHGLVVCLCHSMIYTAAVMGCVMVAWVAERGFHILEYEFFFMISLAFMVFLSHFPLDRWSLAAMWLRMIGGRDLYYEATKERRHSMEQLMAPVDMAFACIVYVIVDNGMHLILMWLAILLLFGGN